MRNNTQAVIMRACLCSALFVALFVQACGGSEESGAPAAGQNAAGAAGSAGVAGTPPITGGAGGVGGVMLANDTAGKACSGDTDCAPGTCATMVEGLDGVPTPALGGYCMASCTMTPECGGGGVCVMAPDQSGFCYESCAADTDCREGYLCGPLTSTCRPAPLTDQLTDNAAGIACAADTECGDGVCLTMRVNREPFPGGYCSGACLDNTHCGAGGVCRRTGAAAGRCYDDCASDTDCTRDGYRCRDLGNELRGCLPAPDPLPDGTTGLACATDADCGGAAGTCVTELPATSGGTVAAPGGYCTQRCEVDLDCGAGGHCPITLGGGRCFKTCAMVSECRDGYVCGERGLGDMPTLVCTPLELVPDAGVDAGTDAGVDAG